MKKTITGIFWTLILSTSPALSTENDKRPDGQKVFSRTQYWEGGKMLREETTYAPETPKSIPPSGMGAWGETINIYNSLPKSEQSSGGTWEDSMNLDTPVPYPLTKEPIRRSGRGPWESMTMMNHPIVQGTPTTHYPYGHGGW